MKAPQQGVKWKGYNGSVVTSSLVPIDGTNPLLGLLNITLEKITGGMSSTGGGGDATDNPIVPTDTNPEDQAQGAEQTSTMPPERTPDVTEVDWMHVQRPIRTHPDFAEMTSTDWSAVESWEKEPNPNIKGRYAYADNSSPSGPTETALSDLAKKYAKCVQRDITSWDDYAPVVRVSAYYTNEPPQNSPCGFISSPPEYSGLANKWVKTADRTTTTGKVNRFQHIQEWQGCDKVLVDKNGIYV